ncbi:unnamed protein product, partial [Tilletia controversa]
MIDCSTTELSAIRQAFPGPLTPDVFFCDWHMLKAVTASSKLKVKGEGNYPKGALRIQDNQKAQKEARSDFLLLMNAHDPQSFDEELRKFMERWRRCEDWTTYIQTFWVPYKKMWARAWRQQPHKGVNTNNYIESWHNQLKTLYLGLMRKQGVDVLLWFLLRQCLQDYHTSELRVGLGLQACSLTKADRAARQKAQDVPYTDALALVTHLRQDGGDIESVTVDSFSNSGHQYALKLSLDALGDEMELVSCPCEAFRI